jgi:hypothetical protein
VAAPTLLIYESVFMILLAVPFLVDCRSRRSCVWAVGWSAAGLVILAAVAGLRFQSGEHRTVQAASEFQVLLPHVTHNVLTGPYECLSWTSRLAVSAAGDIASPHLWAFLLTICLVAGGIWWTWRKIGVSEPGPPTTRAGLRLVLIAALLLFLAYPLSLGLDPANIEGRSSRVHLTAAVGASLLLASLVGLAEARLRARPATLALVAVPLAVASGLLVLNGLRVQDDYARSWAYLRGMWGDVMWQSLDIGPGTLILVPYESLRRPYGMNPWSWEQARLAERLYWFPRRTTPPRLFYLSPGWKETVSESGDLFDGVQLIVVNRRDLEQHRGQDLHFYDAVDGRLQRMDEPIRVGDHEFPVTPRPPAGRVVPYPERALYDALIPPPDAPAVSYAK